MGKHLAQFSTAMVVVSLIGGCGMPPHKNMEVSEKFYKYKSTLGFDMEVPKDFSYSQNAPSNLYYYFGYAQNNEFDLSTIEVYPSFSACSTFALGVSDLKESELDRMKVWTGLVDAYDVGILYDYAGGEEPPCVPPALKFAKKAPDDYGDSMTRIDNSAAYALCSEKDGKRVVVCVQQMTDNPELAEEIFSTFQWTE